jgi:hypothetical protein
MAPKADRDPFVQAVIQLRAHLVKCYKCRAAFDHPFDIPECEAGLSMAIQVADTCNELFKLKRQAVSTINEHVYACPDISVHGEAYALTAQPLSVVATQDGLF